MKSPRETREILDKLESQHPDADTELDYQTPFQLLVATILSAQSTDARVNMVTPALFKRYKDARALAKAKPAELEALIHSTGFYRAKAKSLLGMAQKLVADHDATVPAVMDALVQLPGVGRKTANVVLGHALGVPGLPVDRHVLRVSNRIGIAEGDNPEVVEAQLCGAMPKERWTRTSDTLILHGRRICRPTPLCDQCAVRDDCDYYRLVVARARGRGGKRRRNRRLQRSRNPPGAHRARERGQAREDNDSADAWIEKTFEQLVAEALRSIPRRFRRAMQNIAIVVEDEPDQDLLDDMEVEPPDTLLGLYQGTPLTERTSSYGNVLPDRVLIFQGPHERAADDEDDLVVAIGETLIHEIGHYFGLSEEEIEEIEERYWRGEAE